MGVAHCQHSLYSTHFSFLWRLQLKKISVQCLFILLLIPKNATFADPKQIDLSGATGSKPHLTVRWPSNLPYKETFLSINNSCTSKQNSSYTQLWEICYLKSQSYKSKKSQLVEAYFDFGTYALSSIELRLNYPDKELEACWKKQAEDLNLLKPFYLVKECKIQIKFTIAPQSVPEIKSIHP